MGRKTQDRDIDGAVWAVTQFPATEGLALLTRLMKLFGPALGAAATSDGDIDADGTGGGLQGLSVGRLVSTLVAQLDERETVSLVKRLLKDTRKDGKEILPQFDLEFMGNFMTLFKVLGFVLEVNYGDFFGAVAAGGPEL